MISNLALTSETISGIYNKTLTRSYTSTFGKGKPLSMNVGNVNTYTYGYDAYGRLNGITTPAGSFIYNRPADSDLVGVMTRPNGVNSTWTFEEHRNLLASVTNGSVSTYAYTNDALGRRTGVTRSGSAFADTNILTYGYNPRSELTSALSNVNANYNFAYSYDPIGNRLNSTLAGTNWNYTSNNLNQYTAFTSGSTTQDPTYDADGNMLTRDGWTQTWNGENRLIETYNETTKLTFSYDYMGRRIEKKVFQQTGGIWAPQKSLQYVYDGYKLVEEIDILPDEKPVLRRYTWQPETQGVDVPLVVTDVASNQNYFYTSDANKNISELVDANGNTVAHYEYNPFGKITFQSGAYANNNPFQFSSEYFDSETGLVYYNYRYYSPQLGRWINKDPIQEKGGANLYGMVENRVSNYWDKWGYANIGVFPFTSETNLENNNETRVGNGNQDITGLGGFYVLSSSGTCCCPDKTAGKIVLVQLILNPTKVDAKNADLQKGKRIKDPTGIDRVLGYTDPEKPGDKNSYTGRPYRTGYIDTPGVQELLTKVKLLPKKYKNSFRVEAYCRCSTGDFFTGNSATFQFSRSGEDDLNGKLGPVIDTTGSPSKYPDFSK